MVGLALGATPLVTSAGPVMGIGEAAIAPGTAAVAPATSGNMTGPLAPSSPSVEAPPTTDAALEFDAVAGETTLSAGSAEAAVVSAVSSKMVAGAREEFERAAASSTDGHSDVNASVP